MSALPVVVLFARRDSVYKTLPGTDVYDVDRNAHTYAGDNSVVCHPPCGPWGRMRQFAHLQADQREHGPWAVEMVRKNGGVLEHPEESTLFGYCGLPRPGWFPDAWGGWSLRIEQFHFGHRAEKATWLYIVGTNTVPPLPRRQGRPTHCVRPTRTYPRLPSITKPEREHTPLALAQWLLSVAHTCRSQNISGVGA